MISRGQFLYQNIVFSCDSEGMAVASSFVQLAPNGHLSEPQAIFQNAEVSNCGTQHLQFAHLAFGRMARNQATKQKRLEPPCIDKSTMLLTSRKAFFNAIVSSIRLHLDLEEGRPRVENFGIL